MTPEVEAHSELRKTGHPWIDIIVAGSALVISITSLCVAILHGKTMERMAEANARLVSANSWPILQRYFSTLGRQGNLVWSLNVVNNGVGPAKMESVEVFWKGKPVRTTMDLIEACCRSDQTARAIAELRSGTGGLEFSSIHQAILRAGENRRIIEVPRNSETDALAKQLDDASGEVQMRACYCSVFDECWTTDLRTLHPQRTQSCPAVAVPFTNH